MQRIFRAAAVSFFLLFAFAAVCFSADAAALYQRCVGCHGADGSKPPHVVKGQSADALLAKMKGYADGTYGGAQKGLMANLVKNLSPEDMKVLAGHMAKF